MDCLLALAGNTELQQAMLLVHRLSSGEPGSLRTDSVQPQSTAAARQLAIGHRFMAGGARSRGGASGRQPRRRLGPGLGP